MRELLFATVAMISAAMAGAAQGRVEVDESAIRAELKSGATAVSIPVRNTTGRALPARLHLEWVDRKDVVASSLDRVVSITEGAGSVGSAFPLPASANSDQVYLRLRYELGPAEAGPRVFSTMAGTVALTQIAAHAFILRVSRVPGAQPGAMYSVRAQAVHAAAHKTVAGVRFQASLALGKSRVLSATAEPDADGYAVFHFSVPAAIGANTEAEIRTVAQLGDYRQVEKDTVSLQRDGSVRIETDKRLYQPGQTMHVRAIVSGATGRAAAGVPVKLEISDPHGQKIHTARLQASRFGIVHDDFAIPPNGELGGYHITVSPAGGDRSLGLLLGWDSVQVSRYELAAFVVLAKPDRPAYLPGQNATVEISAAYVFGKPVPKGKVRLVRVGSNHAAGREATDNTIASGDTDDTGRFSAAIDLTADAAVLDAKPAARFADLHFAAYFTDAASGREEERKFDLRISRQPIHVYVVHGEHAGGPLPVPVYINTWYANGTPAETSVRVRLGSEEVATHANQLGVAKVMLNPEPGTIEVLAEDWKGASAHWSEEIRFGTSPRLRLQASRGIYRQGEAVGLLIEAPDAELDVAVHAICKDRTVESRVVHLVNGKGRVEFPYRPEYQRVVSFAAYSGDGREGSAAVVFPDGASLQVSAVPERATLRPGEEASVAFAVKTADGRAVPGALGVSVVDQALLERARTNAEFGRQSSPGCVGCAASPGPSLEDVYALDVSKPIPEGADLSAEMLLASWHATLSIDSSAEAVGRFTFDKAIQRGFAPVAAALDAAYSASFDYPRDAEHLGYVLSRGGIAASELRDPWGTLYAMDFLTEYSNDVIRFKSAGPDKMFGTGDDFDAYDVWRPYFLPQQRAIEHALERWGRCPANESEIRQALLADGISLENLRDPWGTPYRTVIGRNGWQPSRQLVVTSAGPGRKFDVYPGNDTVSNVYIASIPVPCHLPQDDAIRKALDGVPEFPASEDAFRGVLKAAGIDPEKIGDPWDNPFSIRVESSERDAGGGSIRIYEGTAGQRGTPVQQREISIHLVSAGPDGKRGTVDDFDAAEYKGLVDGVSVKPSAESGTISGTIRTYGGSVLPRVRVSIRPDRELTPGPRRQTLTDANGGYSFRGIAAGRHTLVFERVQYGEQEVNRVPVSGGHTTVVDILLKRQARLMSRQMIGGAGGGVMGGIAGGVASTPRVREYFPETLLWEPELETDAQGQAQLKFKLADNITNWRLSVTASTLDGRIAKAGADIRAFQPFFVDHNPPAVVTAGDRLDLPVTIRNYLDKVQPVTVEMQPNAWSEAEGPAKREVRIEAGDSVNVTFPVHVKSADNTARQRVTAIGADDSDAIEKPVRIHPDGQETVQVTTDLVSGGTKLRLTIPAGAIAGATQGELRIYPNLLSTLRDAIEGLVQRPYGCAEQTTSAGYSNLIALRYARSAGYHNTAFEKRAIRNLELTRDRLAGYFAPGGGVSYWERGNADLAVSAYVVRYLIDASAVIAVEPKRIEDLATWLSKQRGNDGLWGAAPGVAGAAWSKTAAVVRGLAAARRADPKVVTTDLTRVYDALAASPEVATDAYVVSQLALAALDLGDQQLAGKAVRKLVELAHRQPEGVSWEGPGGTAFGGWGSGATLETTAASVSALAAWRAAHPADTSSDALIRRGVAYLLRRRDRYGVWFSTQATISVMQAVVAAERVLGGGSARGGKVDVMVNGKLAKTAALPDGTGAADPVTIDLSAELHVGENDVELLTAAGSSMAAVSLVATHWMPWSEATPRLSSSLRFDVEYSRTEARAGEQITCRVDAARAVNVGFGMLLAEVGLPPGAEVDRDSLEAVLHDRRSGVYRYDVLPDHVVLYLWPSKDSAPLSFDFHARFGMEAKSAPSSLYDYYNPEVSAEVAPSVFRIR